MFVFSPQGRSKAGRQILECSGWLSTSVLKEAYDQITAHSQSLPGGGLSIVADRI